MVAGTYSIAACDLERREWGVGVQSKFLAIGALVPAAEPEVGAVATQAWINASFGEAGIGLLRSGVSAEDALARLIADDEDRDRRQVGIVDRYGGAAAYTGRACLEWAGSRLGHCYAAQGNTLVSGETVDALAETFESSRGRPLAERILRSLAGAQSAGGDRRGQQAAALRVAQESGGYGGWKIAVDLRVDDHPEPVRELERLYELHELYFGSTPDDEWLPLDAALEREVGTRLGQLGYASGDLAADLDAWAGTENLEERVRGIARIDPVVLAQLRSA